MRREPVPSTHLPTWTTPWRRWHDPRSRRRLLPNVPVTLATGFGALILVGGFLLSLPIASRQGVTTPPIDALFTATSAVCVTGLVVVDTATYWSPFGHAVILMLMQLGGLGYATSATLLLVVVGRRASLQTRLAVGAGLGHEGPAPVARLVPQIVAGALLVEGIGALLLAAQRLGDLPLAEALWWGVFHAVSAYTNGGFDLNGDFRSMMPFAERPGVLVTLAILVMLGSIGFAVPADLLRRRQWRRLTLDSKLVLVTTGSLLLGGTGALLVLEWANPATLGGLPVEHRPANALFQATTPRTAGFNSLDVAQFREPSLLLTIALMFIGGAAGSLSGGVKVQTLGILWAVTWASVRGRPGAVLAGRELPPRQVNQAVATIVIASALVVGLTLLLTIIEGKPLLTIMFESVSAFATVGMSTGVTPTLSEVGKLLLSLTMFIGRLGPLTFALALAARGERADFRYAVERVRLG